MALSLLLVNVFLFFFAVFLLFYYSNVFRYYYKVYFFIIYLLVSSIFVFPFVLVQGRNVQNMRILRLVFLPLKYIFCIKFNLQEATHLNRKGPYVIVSNHQSNIDFIGLFQFLPDRCTLIAKKEILYYFTVGICTWLSGFIFIDRKERKTAIEAMSAAADSMVQDNFRIWVFPEGTRSLDSTMLPFKSGAFHLAVKAQVPIIPVVMSSYEPFFSKKLKKFNRGTVTIRVLPPVETEGLSPADVPELTGRVQETMLSTFHEISGIARKQTSVPEEDTSQAISS